MFFLNDMHCINSRFTYLLTYKHWLKNDEPYLSNYTRNVLPPLPTLRLSALRIRLSSRQNVSIVLTKVLYYYKGLLYFDKRLLPLHPWPV